MRKHTRVIASLLLFACILAIPQAHSDTLGVLTVQIEASGTSASGTGSWQDHEYDFFGTPINARTLIGDTQFSSSSDFGQTPPSFTGTITSVTPGTFNLSFSGILNATIEELLSGNPVYQIASPDSGSFSTTLTLPADITYLIDGQSTCIANCETATPTFEEIVALNGFETIPVNTGTNVSVSQTSTFFDPTTQTERTTTTDVVFDTVDTAGTTTITASASSAAQFSFGFELLPNPVYFDVITTAIYSGAITICAPYADTNPDDGVVDNTSTPEADLVMMHNESGIFVDRTSTRDTVGNTICATVPSLSEFVVAQIATTTTTTSTSSTTTTTLISIGVPITGQRLALGVDALRPKRNSITITSNDTTIAVTSNPIISGATLHITSSGGGFDLIYPLPAGYWSLIGKPADNKGFRYNDRDNLAGPISSAKISPRSLKIKARGTGLIFALANNPNPVATTIDIGTVRYCASFGGETKFISPKRFTAHNAPAPLSCN